MSANVPDRGVLYETLVAFTVVEKVVMITVAVTIRDKWSAMAKNTHDRWSARMTWLAAAPILICAYDSLPPGSRCRMVIK